MQKPWFCWGVSCALGLMIMTGGQEAGLPFISPPIAEAAQAQDAFQVTSLAKIYGDGEKAAGAALAYPQVIDGQKLSPTDFSVAGKKITAIYTNDKPALTQNPVPGRYVILEFAYENNELTKLKNSPKNSKPKNQNDRREAPMYSDRQAPDVSLAVRQLHTIWATDGTAYAPTSQAIANTAVENPEIQGFRTYTYRDPKTGESIDYELFLPKGYDGTKKYPLLFFVADASANTGIPQMALLQGDGATIWASEAEQEKHPCIILVPEYTPAHIRKLGMLTDDTNTWTKGLTLVSDLLFHIMDTYAVDRTRIYGTGQSQGGMTNIALSDKYPDLFAAQYLVACQWNTEEMAAMKNEPLWITVCEGDTKAYPGMNAATTLWKQLGAKVVEDAKPWNSTLPEEKLSQLVQELIDKDKTAKIHYTVFAGGSHMYTWTFAYQIPAIRDWLFAQRKG